MKNKIITISFVFIIELFFLLNIIIKDIDISKTERRKLQRLPQITINSILDGSFQDDLESYALDQFPYRDSFRKLKAYTNYYLLNKLDNNNIYLNDNGIFKMEYQTNEKSIDEFIKKINTITTYLTKNNNAYSLIIPDKNYYVTDKLFLKINYDLLYKKIKKLKTENIEIRDILTINDYYKTDTHWKQENLDKVIKKMNSIMNFSYTPMVYNKNIYPKFYGVYYGQSALNMKPDTIIYLTNNAVNNCSIKYLENKKLTKIYNIDKLNKFDSYEVFLDGPTSFITIDNKNSITNKELIVFRDSFGSSLIPLLIPYYKNITIIDTRYITSNNYLNKINFTNQDILFLYSTLLVNNSSSLKN